MISAELGFATDMNPSDIKKNQHERYMEEAISVFRGMKGYQPAHKSKYSKSSSWKHKGKPPEFL